MTKIEFRDHESPHQLDTRIVFFVSFDLEIPPTRPTFSNCDQMDVENEFSGPGNPVLDIYIAFYFASLPVLQFLSESETDAKNEFSNDENPFTDTHIIICCL